MTVLLVLEHAPNAQSETQRSFSGGQLVIGRGDDCDWQLEDPNQFVSRKHCLITEEDGVVSVVDASSGGLYIDGRPEPLGPGNTAVLEHQMRLRIGEFVVRVDVQPETSENHASEPSAPKAGSFFDVSELERPASEPVVRPRDLPDPFHTKHDSSTGLSEERDSRPSRPLDQPNPFELDLRQAGRVNSDLESQSERPSGVGHYFDAPMEIADPPAQEPVLEAPVPEKPETPFPPIEVISDPGNTSRSSGTTPPQHASNAEVRLSSQDADFRASLLRGMGLDLANAEDFGSEEIEAIGARFRDLVDGVMFLLRTRAKEKQKVRVAQTIIANSDVNPLKFLASTDEVILALIRERDPSYMSGGKAVSGAYRDLADHQIRTWAALQTALRRMIDRFDPEEIENDLADIGLLERLVAGGRGAKTWQLYKERYRDIAQAAEERFLGEVGADFRDAYETERN